MFVKREGYVLPVTNALVSILNKTIKEGLVEPDRGVVINFSDPNYSIERGGYHPVEAAIDRDGRILYITDYTYMGQPPFSELIKEIDFDFSLSLFQHMGIEYKLDSGRELYVLWEKNFCAYFDFGVFEVEVSGL